MLNTLKNILTITLLVASLSLEAKETIATFKGGEITQAEVEETFRILAEKKPELKDKSFADLNTTTQEQIIRDLIIQKLLTQKAREKKWHKDKAIRQQLKLLEERLIQQAYLADLVQKNIKESEIKKLYKKYTKELKDQQEVKLHHIVLSTQEEATQIRQRILKNQLTFEEGATLYSHNKLTSSQGGDTGYVIASQIQLPIRKALENLKKNTISNPIKTDTGWHIVRLDDKRPAQILAYDQVKASIAIILEKQIIRDYLDKLIKQAAPEIVIKIK